MGTAISVATKGGHMERVVKTQILTPGLFLQKKTQILANNPPNSYLRGFKSKF